MRAWSLPLLLLSAGAHNPHERPLVQVVWLALGKMPNVIKNLSCIQWPLWKLYFWTSVSCKQWEYQLHWQTSGSTMDRPWGLSGFRHGNSAEFLWSGAWEPAWLAWLCLCCVIQTHQILATTWFRVISILVWQSVNSVLANLMKHQFLDPFCWEKQMRLCLCTKFILFFTIFTWFCMFCLGISVAQWVRSIFDVSGMVYTVLSSENVDSE